jgi:hypothetical protein
MTIIDLFTFCAGVGPIFGGIFSGATIGVWGGIFGGVLGSIIGIVNVFAVLAVNKACWRWNARCKKEGRSTAWPRRCGGAFVFVTFIWAIISGVLSAFLTKVIVRLWL